jgi:hypothetical protein
VISFVGLRVLHCPVRVFGWAVQGVQSKRFSLRGVDDVVLGAGGDYYSAAVLKLVPLAVQLNVAITRLDTNELIVTRVPLEADLVTRLQRHEHQLSVGARENHATVILIGKRIVFDVRYVAIHNFLPAVDPNVPGMEQQLIREPRDDRVTLGAGHLGWCAIEVALAPEVQQSQIPGYGLP